MLHAGHSLSELKQHHRLVGCFPLYPPVELIHSFGLVPLILWDLKDRAPHLEESDRHLQPFTCSVARRLTEFVLSNEGSLLDGLLMYNACDTLRNLPEIITRSLGEKGKTLPLLKLHVPMVSQHQTDASAYLADRIRELIIEIENAFGVGFSSQRFLASVRLYNAIRKLSLKMEQQLSEGRMSYIEFSRLIGNGYVMAPEDYLAAMENAVREAEARVSKDHPNEKRIIISGILPPLDAICSAMEEAGLNVVGNDVASQARSYSYIPAEIDDPAVYYADFYRNHHSCTTLLYSSDERLKRLLDLIEKKAAHGLIFIGEKFCEYEYLEMPFIAGTLRQNNVPVLQIEIATDDDDHVEALRTRIEAFSEVLR